MGDDKEACSSGMLLNERLKEIDGRKTRYMKVTPDCFCKDEEAGRCGCWLLLLLLVVVGHLYVLGQHVVRA